MWKERCIKKKKKKVEWKKTVDCAGYDIWVKLPWKFPPFSIPCLLLFLFHANFLHQTFLFSLHFLSLVVLAILAMSVDSNHHPAPPSDVAGSALIFLGTGCSSMVPNLVCLLQPADPPCNVCFQALSVPPERNPNYRYFPPVFGEL